MNDLKKKLKSSDRQVIVTTIQKMQILISKRLQEGTTEYNKIKNLKIAFVVDECHRAVTPKTKRELEKFFGRSLWYGFTGTPRFAENPYPQMGDLARTTEELYGKRLHKYTIQNAIHDNAVLGFQVEHNGAKNLEDETNASVYDNETHILNIVENMKLDCINKVISDFCVTWYASKDDVMYAALHYRNGEIPNESVIKATIDYQSYKDVHEKASFLMKVWYSKNVFHKKERD